MSSSWLLTNLVAGVFLPPLNGLLPAFLGLFLLRRRPRLGRGLIVFGLVVLTAVSTPMVAKGLLWPLENRYAVLPRNGLATLPADAIVILGGGRYRKAPEFAGDDDVKPLTLDRLRYGALVARASGRPVLVAGGQPDGDGRSEAEIMKIVLERDFGIGARWTEERSETTRENALYSAKILLPQGVRRIALVTHAFHMPRAVASFEAAGFEVVPAPTSFLAGHGPVIALDFLPRYDVMRSSGFAIHEAIGLLWYRLRG